GNPVGLVSNLGTGMKDFFYEPAQGMMKSPGEFAKGMSKGTSSLLQKSTFGLFNAASKITGSMSKSLVQMSGDDDYIKKRQEAQSARQKKTNVNHTKDRQDLSEQLSDGFMGIFAKPMAGAREGGTAGFFSGLGKGILGAVVKPTAGLMDLTSKAAEGVRNTSRAGEMLRRVRPPRVHLGDQVLRNYDARSAHGAPSPLHLFLSVLLSPSRHLSFPSLSLPPPPPPPPLRARPPLMRASPPPPSADRRHHAPTSQRHKECGRVRVASPACSRHDTSLPACGRTCRM
ncbi:hypothetical protein T484DRAFT_1631732, partial [Baffinella frigidus]